MNKNRFKLLALILIFFATPVDCFAEEFDTAEVFRCDPIFCPENSAAQGQMARQLRNHIGINPGDPQAQLPNIPRLRIATLPASGIAGSSGNAGRTTTQPTSNAPNGGSSAAPGEQASTESRGGSGTSDWQPESIQSAAVNQPAVNIQPLGKGNMNVNGIVYSDEGGPELEKMAAPSAASTGQLTEPLSPQNAAEANKVHDTGDSGNVNNASRGVASTGGVGNMFGDQDNSPTPTPIAGAVTGGLKALASALGKGAMSVAGSLGLGGGSSTRSAQGQPRFDKFGNPIGPNGKPLKTARVTIDPNTLKDRYGRYISSSKKLEFGAANTLMFQGMCGHYAAYAARNGIPYDRKGCD